MNSAGASALGRPFVPLGGVLLLAFASTALRTDGTNWRLVGVAAAVAALALAAAAWLPWQRLPASALLLLPVACDGVVAVLRHAQGGSSSGYSPLAILPAVWVGLALGRREVVAITACTAVLLGAPIAVFGAPLYPTTGWRGAVLLTIVAAVVGFAVNTVMDTQRRQTRLADARAAELDQLVTTQTTIATASFDLDAVMSTIVQEAQQLTGADAAVIELPDGDELVHRAVAGAAAPYLGVRLQMSSSISGEALRTRQVLNCADSERDWRVDREACRRMAARSILVVPLLHDDEPEGVLKVYSSWPNAFQDEHARVLSLLASMMGTALVRASLLQQLSEQAVTDELTGLPNRRGWYQQLELALARSRRSGTPLSVVLLDLNGFKQVNDLEGHAAGDRLLRTVGARWSNALRESDLLGRVGGDEFAVILEGADGDAARMVIGRLDDALAGLHTASGGHATWDGVEKADALLARADAQMYRSKKLMVA